MIDLHCHLDLYPTPGRVIAEADKRDMFVLAVTTTPKAFAGNLRLVEGRNRIRVAVGLHPELVATRHREVHDLCRLMPQTKYVGEVGIDGSPDHVSSFAIQKEVFETIIDQAESLGGKIVSIHSRGAATAVLDVIEARSSKSLPVLHWFTGTRKELDRAISLGCWFSAGPAMVRGRKGRDLLAAMPKERVLTETDGPFATDGKAPLMPWGVEQMGPALADLWGSSLDEVDRQMRFNLRQLVSQHDGANAA
jgi:TatD DNase family protein